MVVSIKTSDSLDDPVKLCIVLEKTSSFVVAHFSRFDGFRVRNKASEPSNHSSTTGCGYGAPTCLRNGLFHLQRQCGAEPP